VSAGSGRVERAMSGAPAEVLFLASAISQYVGAAIAVNVFDDVEPQTVAWFRVIGAAVALLAVSPGFQRGWSRRELAGAAIFGIATALMNLCFYLAIDRIDLGKSVAIEFIGPIAVAAVMTRSTRNALALGLAVIGVVTLGGVELGNEPVGLLFVLLASALWAAYIVIGSRVAQANRGVAGLGVGLAIGALAITPTGAPWSGPVWVSPALVLLCCATGVFSNAIGYGIDQHVLRRIPIRRFSVLLALLPVTALAVGWVALDQEPGALDLAGMALVLAGVAIQERESITADEPEPS
jgi:inner membrane transporter RhtA